MAATREPKTIFSDPSLDYTKHPGRLKFERIRESGNIDLLMNYIEAFISKGHNLGDGRDEMYAIMGISPDFLDAMKHEFAEQKLANTDVFFNKAAKKALVKPEGSGPGASHGKSKKLKNTFDIDED